MSPGRPLRPMKPCRNETNTTSATQRKTASNVKCAACNPPGVKSRQPLHHPATFSKQTLVGANHRHQQPVTLFTFCSAGEQHWTWNSETRCRVTSGLTSSPFSPLAPRSPLNPHGPCSQRQQGVIAGVGRVSGESHRGLGLLVGALGPQLGPANTVAN